MTIWVTSGPGCRGLNLMKYFIINISSLDPTSAFLGYFDTKLDIFDAFYRYTSLVLLFREFI